MDRFALAWTGDRFVRISARNVTLPEGRRLLPDGYPIDRISASDLAGMTAAMRINPTVRAFVAPGLLTFGHADALDRIMHTSHPDPEWREAYGPTWHPSRVWGQAWRRWQGRAATIYVRSQERELISTTYHELFHTIVGNLADAEWIAIEAACAPYREWNASLPEGHPDRAKPLGLIGEEEPAAYSFERFATGQFLPFKLPWRVRRTFRRIVAGRYADHLCAGPEPPQ